MNQKILEVTLELNDKLSPRLQQTSGASSRSINKITESTHKMERAFKKANRRMMAMAQGFGRFGKALTVGVSLPIIALGATVAKMGIDVAESQSLVEVSFGRMTEAVKTWSQTSSAAIIQTTFDIQEQAAMFFNVARGMGVTERASYDLATAFTEMSADFASFYNLRPDEAMTKLRGAITGEFEPLKQLGIVLNVATIEAQALKDGLIVLGEEMDTATRVQATYNAIVERAGPAMGDVARTADGTANRIRALQADLRETGQVIGLELLPVVSELVETLAPPLIDALTGAAEAFSDMDEEQRKTALGMTGLAIVTGPVIVGLSEIAQGIIAITLFARESRAAMRNLVAAILLLRHPLVIAAAAGIGLGYAWGKAFNEIEKDAMEMGAEIEAAAAAQAGAMVETTQVLEDYFAARDIGMLGPQPITQEQIDAMGAEAEAAVEARIALEELEVVVEDLGEVITASGGFTDDLNASLRTLNTTLNNTETASTGAAGGIDALTDATLNFGVALQSVQDIYDAAERPGAFGIPSPYPTSLQPQVSPGATEMEAEAYRRARERFPGIRVQHFGYLGAFTGTGIPEPEVTEAGTVRFTNEIMQNIAASMIGGFAAGGPTGALAAGLPIIGTALFGPVGGAVGGFLGGLIGKKRRGDSPSNPIFTKIINPEDLATAFLGVTKGLIAAGGAAGMNVLVQDIRAQAQRIGAS